MAVRAHGRHSAPSHRRSYALAEQQPWLAPKQHPVLRLQRLIGNQATTRLLLAQREPDPAATLLSVFDAYEQAKKQGFGGPTEIQGLKGYIVDVDRATSDQPLLSRMAPGPSNFKFTEGTPSLK